MGHLGLGSHTWPRLLQLKQTLPFLGNILIGTYLYLAIRKYSLIICRVWSLFHFFNFFLRCILNHENKGKKVTFNMLADVVLSSLPSVMQPSLSFYWEKGRGDSSKDSNICITGLHWQKGGSFHILCLHFISATRTLWSVNIY